MWFLFYIIHIDTWKTYDYTTTPAWSGEAQCNVYLSRRTLSHSPKSNIMNVKIIWKNYNNMKNKKQNGQNENKVKWMLNKVK